VRAGSQRLVNLAQEMGGAFGLHSNNDTVGMEEIGDGGAFAEKLGIRDNVEGVARGAVALEGTGDPLVGVDGNGAFFDDDLVAINGAGDGAGHRVHVG